MIEEVKGFIDNTNQENQSDQLEKAELKEKTFVISEKINFNEVTPKKKMNVFFASHFE